MADCIDAQAALSVSKCSKLNNIGNEAVKSARYDATLFGHSSSFLGLPKDSGARFIVDWAGGAELPTNDLSIIGWNYANAGILKT